MSPTTLPFSDHQGVANPEVSSDFQQKKHITKTASEILMNGVVHPKKSPQSKEAGLHLFLSAPFWFSIVIPPGKDSKGASSHVLVKNMTNLRFSPTVLGLAIAIYLPFTRVYIYTSPNPSIQKPTI